MQKTNQKLRAPLKIPKLTIFNLKLKLKIL